MASIEDPRTFLEESLGRRAATPDVARAIVALEIPGLPVPLRRELEQLAGSRSDFSFETSMPSDFERVVAADDQLRTLERLFDGLDVDHTRAGEPSYLEGRLVVALTMLGAPAGASALDALRARAELARAGNAPSPGALHKRLRFLRRFEQKIERMRLNTEFRQAQMQAKSRLAHAVGGRDCDDLTLAFVSYLAARANRRSMFLFGAQSRAFDSISEALHAVMREREGVNWFAVAHVMPTTPVIGRLSVAERGSLIGLFHEQMVVSANRLGVLWSSLPERMREEMVMVRDVDSSRWNAYAGSFNTMRSAWIAAMRAADLEDALDAYLPGKAARLMASDLVWGYRALGEELHEDTRMFSALPHPWTVIAGEAEQGRNDIIAKATTLSVDALATGWVGPRSPTPIEIARAEPELVHGIAIADPALAARLRRAGAFSGKTGGARADLPDTLMLGWERAANGTAVYPVVHPAPE
ncbi:hypothetical protein [Miltoncostaea oceani]|uniref:hypothetical protein n=1 Tax=Miltoncostaea oceani TaxID=2843216 RepID=UPI001C3D9866|nr:hypothetical protein [Miltoncostaea oceani]